MTIWSLIVAVFLFFQLIMLAWEKIDYTFSLEWFIAKIAGVFIPSKKNADKKHWWDVKRLDAQDGLIDIEPIHYVTAEEVDHEHFEDSRLSFRLAILGWIFFPLMIASWVISRQAVKTEQPNKYLKKTRIMNTIGMILIIFVIIFCCFFSIYDLTGIDTLL